MMFNLTGMTALVTGSSGGIGSAIARALAGQGARLALSGSNGAKLRTFREQLNDETGPRDSGDHVEITCDLSNTTQVEELILGIPELSPHFQCVLDRDGTLDTLTVRVEQRAGVPAEPARAAGGRLRALVKARIGVSVTVDVVELAAVERSVGKMRRIVDRRPAR